MGEIESSLRLVWVDLGPEVYKDVTTSVSRGTWEPARGGRLLIGLSYSQGTAKYPLYREALHAAADAAGLSIDVEWLAEPARQVDWDQLRRIDGLLLTGGADVEPARYGLVDNGGLCRTFPGRDAVELEIIEAAFARSIPIFAICRGMQLVNVWRGGTLIPNLPRAVDHQLPDAERHPVRIEPDSQLARLCGSATAGVTSIHHQAVDRPGDGLRIVATASDGVVEAVEWADPSGKPWLVAVQWHPERMSLDEPLAGPLYEAFLAAVRSGAAVRASG